MFIFVIRRVLISIPVLFASSLLTFVLVKLSGDPLQGLKLRNPPVPKHTIELEEQRLYLDRSWPQQYWHWITNLFKGTFGPSVAQNNHIGEDLADALAVTARLVIAAVLIALLLAVITGVVSAVKQYSITDYTTTAVGFLFLSMPTFWFAILLKQGGLWWNDHVKAGWNGDFQFFTIGDKSVFLTDDSTWAQWRDRLGHTVLPVIVLALVGYASWTRFTRASMLEVLNSEYVRLARAKGITPRRVLVKHALRTALIPLTTVTALDVAALLGGAVVTETVFQWHGMGFLFLNGALRTIDFNLMLGWLMVTATIVILFNLLADIMYGVLDPRIRHA